MPAPEGSPRKAQRRWSGQAKFAVDGESGAILLASDLKEHLGYNALWDELDIEISDNIVLITEAVYTARGANAADLEREIRNSAARVGEQIVSDIAIRTTSSVKLGPGK